MKLSVILFSVLFFAHAALADTSIVFEGMDMKLLSSVDEMTDKKSGTLLIMLGPVYIAISGHDKFVIGSSKGDVIFAHDEKHLIRVGENKPYTLTVGSKRNFLSASNGFEAESVITHLLKGGEVKLRYFEWPRYNKTELNISNGNAALVYNKGVSLFGWKDLGIAPVLAPVVLSVHNSKSPEDVGYALVQVQDISDLSLVKGFDKYGGGTSIRVGVNKAFGIFNGKWVCDSVALSGGKYMIIRDAEDKVVFKEELPKDFGGVGVPKWPTGKQAAVAAWNASPLGSIEVEGTHGKKVMLYGFRELWTWGVENAGLPSLEAK